MYGWSARELDEIRLTQAIEMLRLIRRHQAEQALERYTVSVNAFMDTLGAAFSKSKPKKSGFVKALEKEIDEVSESKNIVKFEEITEVKRKAKALYPHLFDQVIAKREAK